jgi:NTP pyrophosphatase (non-canonical NTP hydrolase)
MNFNDYQDAAASTAMFRHEFYPIASLMIEAAELADLFTKPMLRGDSTVPTQDEIISEAGDVLWNLAAILTLYGINLEDVAEYNLQKLQRRQKNGTITGSGER